MAMLLGKKVGMTQIYDESGQMTPVTVLLAGPCTILQVKTPQTDGYCAVQLGFEDVKPSRVKKPEEGHAKKSGTTVKRFVREWRLSQLPEETYKPGSQLDVKIFSGVQYVDVSGVSKGKGFAGVMKRHGFGGMPASHGTERKHRTPGSLSGHGSDRGHGGNLKKGKRMAGHMGMDRVTSRNHKLIWIDEANNLLAVKGAVPGPAGGYVEIRTAKTKK
ncbi:MAG: 50S ribosomal protein L3 [Phycisphaerae bacterium]|jgi:large subunit ribosomal protein L3|nr:50S ribosomal protein L3 [Phycisphaerae bacterium]